MQDEPGYVSAWKPKNFLEAGPSAAAKEKLTEAVTNGESLTTPQAAAILGVKHSRARLIIAELARVGVLKAYGANRDRVYRLKKD
jgi:predicted transcriptional regulator of viral defense system